MNTYEEVTESVLPYYIDPNGEIKWTKTIVTFDRNKELETRTDLFDFFQVKGELAYTYRKGNNRGGELMVCFIDPKTNKRRFKNYGEFENFSRFVQNTLVPLGNDEFVMGVMV